MAIRRSFSTPLPHSLLLKGVIVLGCLIIHPLARAQFLGQCQSAASSSDGDCTQAAGQAVSNDGARGAAGLAASSQSINPNAGIQSPAIAGNNADWTKAIAQCEKDKADCEKKCDKAKQQAEQKAKGPPPDQAAAQEAQQIPGVKQSKCTQPIDEKLQQMKAGQKPLDQQKKEADQTKEATDKGGGGGGMPQMPQMPQSKDSNDTGSSAAAVTPPADLNCSAAGASRFSDCNATFTTKCMSSMANSECDVFSDRFCNLNSGAATPTLQTAKTNLVIDQKGEGLGSNYCNYALSSRYCQTAGRDQCPSCTSIYAQTQCAEMSQCSSAQSSAAVVNSLRTSCPDDPYYVTGGFTVTPVTGVAANGSGFSSPLDGTGASSSATASITSGLGTPPVTSASTGPLVTGASVGGGGVSGGGSGGGSSGGGGSLGGGGSSSVTAASATSNLQSNREGLPNGIIAAAAGGDGGGGGGGSSPAAESAWTGEVPSLGALTGKRTPAAAPVAGLASDVANVPGPSVFNIGSTGIHNFCVHNQLTGCAK